MTLTLFQALPNLSSLQIKGPCCPSATALDWCLIHSTVRETSSFHSQTDLVSTPSHSFGDIPAQERKQSVPALLHKIAFYRPRVLALNSFTIWADIASQLDKRNGLEGIALKGPSGHTRPPVRLPRLQENRKPHFIPWKIVYTDVDELETESVKETLIMPLPGTSGANASYSVRTFKCLPQRRLTTLSHS